MNELPTRVAAWQCRPGSLDVAGNLRRLDAACALAVARRATVLVTPEMFTSGYAITPDGARQLAEPRGGPAEAAVSAIARRHQVAIAYGHPELASDGSVYNAATLVGADGAVRGRHRKVHLYGDLDRANYCGADDVFQYNGRSTICGPRGEVLAQAAADGEELVVADLSAGPVASYLADRRPELYATGRSEGDTCT